MTEKTLIIAEAGVNHNGDIRMAEKLIDVAAQSGADAVKFQSFSADRLILKGTEKAQYQLRDGKSGETQYELLKRLELCADDQKHLANYCRKKHILFLSSPFDMESMDFLTEIGLTIFKIPSGEITNLPYLRKVGSLKKEVILSTGMSTLDEVGSALDTLIQSGSEKKKITVLHCNTEYPTPMEDVNLMAMVTIQKTFDVAVGYSDHTLGIEIPISAVALGASVIEKHFTLDKKMEGPDHKSSLEPLELMGMVNAIRNIEKAMGNGIKAPSPSELKNKMAVRKSIVAQKKILKGELLADHNLTVKRPATGISPARWDEVIGKRAIRDFMEDEQISL